MKTKREILDRYKEAKGFSTDIELANHLGINKSTISNWVKRNTVDYDLLFSKIENVDYNWLLSGQYGLPKDEYCSVNDVDRPQYTGYEIPLYSQIDFSICKIKNCTKVNTLKIPNINASGALIANEKFPKLKKGDIIVFETMNNENVFDKKTDYIIETSERLFIDKIEFSENELMLKANANTLKSANIKGLAKIVAIINIL